MYNKKCNNCCCKFMNMNNCPNKTMNISEEILEDSCDNYATMPSYDEDECNCGFNQGMPVFPEDAVLAQSYVPYQFMDKTFKPCVGLKMGTIFPELVSPYMPCKSIEEIEFIKAANKIGKGCNQYGM